MNASDLKTLRKIHRKLRAKGWLAEEHLDSLLEYKGGEDYALLHYAAARRRPKLAKELLRLGADANVRSSQGLTPLHVAAMAGRLRTAKCLVAAGADLQALNDAGRMPHECIGRGRVHSRRAELLYYLLRQGAPPTVEVLARAFEMSSVLAMHEIFWESDLTLADLEGHFEHFEKTHLVGAKRVLREQSKLKRRKEKHKKRLSLLIPSPDRFELPNLEDRSGQTLVDAATIHGERWLVDELVTARRST